MTSNPSATAGTAARSMTGAASVFASARELGAVHRIAGALVSQCRFHFRSKGNSTGICQSRGEGSDGDVDSD